MNRRHFLLSAGAVAAQVGRGLLLPQSVAAASEADHTLRISPVSFELAPGKIIRTVGYNGSVPGPLLRMKEGKKVTIDIFNDTDTPELVHWHGLPVSAKQGNEGLPGHAVERKVNACRGRKRALKRFPPFPDGHCRKRRDDQD